MKNLEEQKKLEREKHFTELAEQELKTLKFKEHAEKQRRKVKEMKNNQDILFDDEEADQLLGALRHEAEDQPAPEETKSVRSRVSMKSKKSQKPAWAMTEKQQEEEKEKEIDDLLEFAFDLDYEKFMEDFEVR